MSTSVIHPGTTSKAGRSGRFLGMAAVGLAVVVAVSVVFAVNQGNDAVVSGGEPRLDQGLGASYMRQNAEDFPTELKRLLAQVEAVNSASSPTANIERYRLELAGIIGGEPSPTANIERYRFELQNADRALDAWSQRLQGLADWTAAQDAATTESNLQHRLAHEFVEEESSGAGGVDQGNPRQDIAE